MSHEPFDSATDLTLAGGPIRLYAAGDPEAEPVLLLHGAMLDSARLSWHFLAPRLATSRRVYAIDLPRHGRSRPWYGVLDHERCLRIVRAVVEHLDVRSLALIGLSMGGALSIDYALLHPECVSRAVLLAPGGLDERRRWQFTSWASLRIPGLVRGSSWLLARFPRTVRYAFTANLVARERTPDFDVLLPRVREEAEARWAHREPAVDDWQVTSFGPSRMRTNLLPRVGNLTIPTLWIRGVNDPLVGESEMSWAAETCGGRFVSADDAGHLLPLDQPDWLFRAVEQFLTPSVN